MIFIFIVSWALPNMVRAFKFGRKTWRQYYSKTSRFPEIILFDTRRSEWCDNLCLVINWHNSWLHLVKGPQWLAHQTENVIDTSTPPAKKTEPSNLVLRAQDHKKNPKFKGWQWDLKNPKFKIRSSKERRTKSEITEIVVEKYVFKIPKIQNFRNTRNQ